MQRSLLAASFLVLAAAAPAQTTHYWVDAQNGADTNPGTAQAPFRSITKAMSLATLDADVHVLPGVYGPTQTNEQFSIQIGLGSVYKNLRILGTDATRCIVDFGGQPASASYYFQVWDQAENIEITGLTFRNGATSPWYAAAIGWQDCKDLRIHGCVFENLVSGLIGWRGAQRTMIHDNVLDGCGVGVRFRMELTAWGAVDNRLYNNVVHACSGDGISLASDDPSQIVANNVVLACGGTGIGVGTLQSGIPTVEANCAFGNGTDYSLPFALPASNLTVDPLLVAPGSGDWHLQPGSPCIEAGFAVGPGMTNDFYRGGRVVDFDGDRRAVPDIGAHEVNHLTMTVTGWLPGTRATFTFTPTGTATVTAAVFLFGALPAGTTLQPYGSVGVDLSALVLSPLVGVPSSASFPVPALPALTGLYGYAQAVGVLPTPTGTAFAPSGRLDLLF